jgi:hypothetical protein
MQALSCQGLKLQVSQKERLLLVLNSQALRLNILVQPDILLFLPLLFSFL